MEEHNETWGSLPTPDKIRVIQTFNTIYVVEGFLLSFINFFLIISVLKSPVTSTYKEYIIFCGKAGFFIFADGFYGFSYFIYGVCGLVAYSTNYYSYHFDTLHCLFHNFYNTMFLISVPLTGMSITMVAVDRFIATMFPHLYYPLTVSYSWKMNIALISISLIGVPICYVYALLHIGEIHISNYCSINNAVYPEFWPYLRSMRIGGTVCGILLYIPIAINLVNHSKKVAFWTQGGRLRNVTLTIGVTTVVEFCLFLLPECCILFKIFPDLSEYFYFIMLTKGIVNMFVYTSRHREIKKAILKLLNLKGNSTVAISTIRSDSKRLTRVSHK